jgi:hypothetical protein
MMVVEEYECSACVQRFKLNAEGNIPLHDKPIVRQCFGSNRPPAKKFTTEPQLPDSKEDFEISTRNAWGGHPGSGRRR